MNLNTQAPHAGLNLGIERQYETQIISLTNSAHYLLNHAIIVMTKERSVQLIVKGHGTLLTVEPYDTVKGAKIAFLKFHQLRALNESIKPMWSKPYRPAKKWLDEKVGTQTEVRRDN